MAAGGSGEEAANGKKKKVKKSDVRKCQNKLNLGAK